ncbi:MAG: nitrilase-related carbon-nitrogen hydrolase [Oscillospiraceae bacterium]
MSDFNLKFASLAAPVNTNIKKAIDEIDMLEIKPSEGPQNAKNHNRFRISTVKLKKQPFNSIKSYIAYIDSYMKTAKENNCALIAFPELCSLLPLSITIGGDKVLKKLSTFDLPNLDEYFNQYIRSLGQWSYELYINVFRTFAKAYNMVIVAGSAFVMENGKYYNRSFVFDENGEIIGTQDKLFLSEYEKRLGLSVGTQINIIETCVGNLTILNDYDCFFFETAKIAKNLGANMIFSSQISRNSKIHSKCHESLIWRCEEQNLYGIESSYELELINTQCSFIAPAVLTKNQMGILSSSNDYKTITYLLNFDKLNNKFDPYTSDRNQYFYKNYNHCVYFD